MRFRPAWLGFGAAALLLSGVVIPASADQGHQSQGTSSSASCNDGTVTASPSTLWPPNHKPVTVTISYAESTTSAGKTTPGDGDNDTISITKITETMVDADGAVNADGQGAGSPKQSTPDYVGPSSLPSGPDTVPQNAYVQVRSERAGAGGNGSGRVYYFTVSCNDKSGTSVTDPAEDGPTGEDGMAMVYVCVPHDMSAASRAFCASPPPPPAS